jgi:hypothetical protein
MLQILNFIYSSVWAYQNNELSLLLALWMPAGEPEPKISDILLINWLINYSIKQLTKNCLNPVVCSAVLIRGLRHAAAFKLML